MKNHRDLTEFFLEWRDTCAIDKCTRMDDVNFVHALFDARLRNMIRDARPSGLGRHGGTMAISEFSGTDCHAFNLVESEFYRSGEKSVEEGGKKFGQALKDFLFGNDARQTDSGRLNGYFLQMLRTVANRSFRGSAVSDKIPGNSKKRGGNEDDDSESDSIDNVPAPERTSVGDPVLPFAVKECLADFRESLLSFWNGASTDMRLAALCFATGGEVPFSNPVVVEASGLKSSAFANRKERVLLELRTIVGSLSKDHDPDDLQIVVGKNLRSFLEEFGRQDPTCAPFFEVT